MHEKHNFCNSLCTQWDNIPCINLVNNSCVFGILVNIYVQYSDEYELDNGKEIGYSSWNPHTPVEYMTLISHTSSIDFKCKVFTLVTPFRIHTSCVYIIGHDFFQKVYGFLLKEPDEHRLPTQQDSCDALPYMNGTALVLSSCAVPFKNLHRYSGAAA